MSTCAKTRALISGWLDGSNEHTIAPMEHRGNEVCVVPPSPARLFSLTGINVSQPCIGTIVAQLRPQGVSSRPVAASPNFVPVLVWRLARATKDLSQHTTHTNIPHPEMHATTSCRTGRAHPMDEDSMKLQRATTQDNIRCSKNHLNLRLVKTIGPHTSLAAHANDFGIDGCRQ